MKFESVASISHDWAALDVTRYLKLAEEVFTVFWSLASWETKFELIIDRLAPQLRELYPLRYCDPDTSYMEDVVAYVAALNDQVAEITKAYSIEYVDLGHKITEYAKSEHDDQPRSLKLWVMLYFLAIFGAAAYAWWEVSLYRIKIFYMVREYDKFIEKNKFFRPWHIEAILTKYMDQAVTRKFWHRSAKSDEGGAVPSTVSMADRTSAEIFGTVFEMLASDKSKEEIAQYLWGAQYSYDFDTYQMYVDNALITLGFAREVSRDGEEGLIQYKAPNGVDWDPLD